MNTEEDKASLCKVLFIGPYRQPDGWGSFSRSIIASLLSIEEINLTTRPIFLSGSPQFSSEISPELRQVWQSLPIDPNIFKCETNKQTGYDVLIQHLFNNIALLFHREGRGRCFAVGRFFCV